MLKQLNRNKKKKGFTLIELVIVLAVLAIIALIAIPNFNKVRTDSQKKADDQTCEVIENVTLMAIAQQDMVTSGIVTMTVSAPTAKGNSAAVSDIGGTVAWLDSTPTATDDIGKTSYQNALKEINEPQEKNKATYLVTINADESVDVVTQ